MFYEYAVDPKTISTWDAFQYLLESYGVTKGRLVSRYPRRWKRLVVENLDCSENDRMRIVEALAARVEDMLWKRNHEWDGNLDWLQNALKEHQRAPFHAIITIDNPDDIDVVRIKGDLDDNDELWKASGQKSIPRTAKNICSTIAPLLECARSLYFVDPNFAPDATRFTSVLKELLSVACDSRTEPLERIEYHLEWKERYDYPLFAKLCEENVKKVLPKGVVLRLVRWTQTEGEEKLHDRYILTDRAGVDVTVGLDRGKPGEKTRIRCIDAELYGSVFAQFLAETPTQTYRDEVVIST